MDKKCLLTFISMEDKTPQLNPADLYQRRKSKDSSRLRAYNKILEQIYTRIRTISRLPINSQCYLLYTVPPFILGLPKIDIEDCVVYLIYQLRHAGYEVRYTFPNLLYISWEHHEKSYLVEQSPIMQAMIESAEKVAAEQAQKEKAAARLLGPGRKSQRKVKFQEPGALSSPGGALGGRGPSRSAIQNVLSVGPPPPSAADYVPPPAFLQKMTNPTNQVVYPKSVPEYFRQ